MKHNHSSLFDTFFLSKTGAYIFWQCNSAPYQSDLCKAARVDVTGSLTRLANATVPDFFHCWITASYNVP